MAKLTKKRRIRADGSTKTISLPADICDLFGWDVGDRLIIGINYRRSQIILTKDSHACENVKTLSNSRIRRSQDGQTQTNLEI